MSESLIFIEFSLETFRFLFRFVEGKDDLEFGIKSLVHELSVIVNSLVGHCCDFVYLIETGVGDFKDLDGIDYFTDGTTDSGESKFSDFLLS
jgi:hypothetical protein